MSNSYYILAKAREFESQCKGLAQTITIQAEETSFKDKYGNPITRERDPNTGQFAPKSGSSSTIKFDSGQRYSDPDPGIRQSLQKEAEAKQSQMAGVKDAISRVTKDVRNSIDNGVKSVSDQLEGLQKRLQKPEVYGPEDQRATLKGRIDKAMSDLNTWGKSMGTSLNTTANDFQKKIEDAMNTPRGKQLSEQLNNFNTSLNNTKDQIKTSITNVTGPAWEGVQKQIESLEMQKKINQAGAPFRKIGESVAATYDEVAKSCQEATKDAKSPYEAVNKAFEATKKIVEPKIKEQYEKAKGAVQEQADKAATATTNLAMGAAGTAFGTVMGALASATAVAGATAATKAQDSKGAAQGFYQQMSNALFNANSAVLDGMNIGTGFLEKSRDFAGTNSDKAFEKVLSKVANRFKDYQGIVDQLSNDNIMNSFNSLSRVTNPDRAQEVTNENIDKLQFKKPKEPAKIKDLVGYGQEKIKTSDTLFSKPKGEWNT